MLRMPPVPQDSPEAKRSNLEQHRVFFRRALDTCSACLVDITTAFAAFERLQVSDLTDTEVDIAETDLYLANKDMDRVRIVLKTASFKVECLGPHQVDPEATKADDKDQAENMELEVNKATLQVAIDALTHIRKRLNAQKAVGGAAKKPRLA
tara:strand:+ start:463 stop:918 length:456 start_codon:yes stop_codon:yes gene_type:complete